MIINLHLNNPGLHNSPHCRSTLGHSAEGECAVCQGGTPGLGESVSAVERVPLPYISLPSSPWVTICSCFCHFSSMRSQSFRFPLLLFDTRMLIPNIPSSFFFFNLALRHCQSHSPKSVTEYMWTQSYQGVQAGSP